MRLVARIVWRNVAWKCYELIACGHHHARPIYWKFIDILPCSVCAHEKEIECLKSQLN